MRNKYRTKIISEKVSIYITLLPFKTPCSAFGLIFATGLGLTLCWLARTAFCAAGLVGLRSSSVFVVLCFMFQKRGESPYGECDRANKVCCTWFAVGFTLGAVFLEGNNINDM